MLGTKEYYTEAEFRSSKLSDDNVTFLYADPLIDHQRIKLINCALTVQDECIIMKNDPNQEIHEKVIAGLKFNYDSVNQKLIQFFSKDLTDLGKEYQLKNLPVTSEERKRLVSSVNLADKIEVQLQDLKLANDNFDPNGNFLVKKVSKALLLSKMEKLVSDMHKLDMLISGDNYPIQDLSKKEVEINTSREDFMIKNANNFSESISAVWKVGDSHISNILDKNGPHMGKDIKFMILSKSDLDKMVLKESLKKAQSKIEVLNLKAKLKVSNPEITLNNFKFKM